MGNLDDYLICQRDGLDYSHTLREFNLLDENFPRLEPRHFTKGFWWLVYRDRRPVAFAGLVPFVPFDKVGYLKRCFVKPDHRGHGLQLRLIASREVQAMQLGWTQLIADCPADNPYAANNYRRAGFAQFEPEQRFGDPDTIYWHKQLSPPNLH